jgi:hypothetical protein
MIRSLAAVLMLMAAASCSGSGTSSRLDLRENSYILAESLPGRGTCYTRVISSVPTDQVCHHRNQVRYSTDPRLSRLSQKPIPAYVLALFEATPKPQ